MHKINIFITETNLIIYLHKTCFLYYMRFRFISPYRSWQFYGVAPPHRHCVLSFSHSKIHFLKARARGRARSVHRLCLCVANKLRFIMLIVWANFLCEFLSVCKVLRPAPHQRHTTTTETDT